jgi:hypothetical protein
MTYAITQLWDGPRFERIEGGFARKSAALAHLIDKLNATGAKAIFHDLDAENDAYDVIADFGGYAFQYLIEAEAAK